MFGWGPKLDWCSMYLCRLFISVKISCAGILCEFTVPYCFCRDIIDTSHVSLQIGTDMLVEGYLQPIPVATDTSMVCAPHTKVISFYKPWDLYGALSNFSPHPICLPDMTGDSTIWSSVEHYYQVYLFRKSARCTKLLHNGFSQYW